MSQLHLTLAPGQASFVDLLSALEETNYNQSLPSLESFVTFTPSLDEAPHPTCILPLTGLSVGTVQIVLYEREDSLRRGHWWSWVKVEGWALLRVSASLGRILL